MEESCSTGQSPQRAVVPVEEEEEEEEEKEEHALWMACTTLRKFGTSHKCAFPLAS
jgi:hypothetical protein